MSARRPPLRVYMCDNHRHCDLGECMDNAYRAAKAAELWWFDGNDEVTEGWYCEDCWDGYLHGVTKESGVSWDAARVETAKAADVAPWLLHALERLVKAVSWMERTVRTWPRDSVEPHAEAKAALRLEALRALPCEGRPPNELQAHGGDDMTTEDVAAFEVARKARIARAEELLAEKGVVLDVGSCGCCHSPWVRIAIDGEVVLDDNYADMGKHKDEDG